ncbi:MAG: autotransporter outer membrane beta-barrel domain-containing protein [Veillonella sp.]|uniref:autotransporter outer membrane beta-barrel domain-containing protein n=1 Tax=Veillonella sp. TaxID=1926307 RepID=UPI00290C5BF1|nr:autotransporter outer membrane beta-barrel domain-containing protein [Veillonella sp.]MDU4762791.1 autotransporter outer membrane beta-barrel domain-containing protein [Veillonella sp.]
MKHMSKTKLSLVIALAIAGSIMPNAMAIGEDGIIKTDDFLVWTLGKVPTPVKFMKADNRSMIAIDEVHAHGTEGFPAIIVAKNNGTVGIREGIIQVGDLSIPAAISNGGVVVLGFDNYSTEQQGYKINIEGDVRIDGHDETSSIIHIGIDNEEASWTGFALNLADKNSPHDNHINVFLGEKGKWDHMYQGGLSGTSYNTMTTPSHVHRLVGAKNRNFLNSVTQSEHNEIHIDKLEGHVNFIYDSNGEDVDSENRENIELKNGLTPDTFWSGDIHITSAAPNSGAHLYTSQKGLDMSTEENVDKILDNLAHKVYYHNYVTGERNLQGTVAIASSGAESGRFKVLNSGYAKEGAITWQADKDGQGRYGELEATPAPTPQPEPTPAPTPQPEPTPAPAPQPEPTPVPAPQPEPTPAPAPQPEPTPAPAPQPEPTPVPAPQPEPAPAPTPQPEPAPAPAPVATANYDTPHMRGARSAIMSNINGWRTLTDNMYRPRVLQQGEPTGIWARVGGGKYSFNTTGIDTDTTYTRIQGGYDAKTSSGWTVGGQVSYLRGNDDYVFNGTGKEKAFAVGAYGLKDLGNNQYIHIESQVGRTSNDFTVRNEIGERLSGETKANAYSIGARYGKTVKLSNGTYIEPQAQLSYTHFGSDSFNAGSMHVEQSGVSSTVGGLGLEIGKNFGAGNIYTRVGVNHAFSGTVKTAYTSGATTKYTSEDIKGTWTDLAFGGRYGFNANNSIFADISTGLSGDYKAGWSVNAGFTHKF